jgi:site-specific DNA-cytosine methylase
VRGIFGSRSFDVPEYINDQIVTLRVLIYKSLFLAAIDIIMGGPPCVDYSQVNANRKGTNGKQGQYMLAFGLLIRTIESHPLQNDRPLFFFSENVELTKHDLEQVRTAYAIDWDPVLLDASDVSPCRRKRHFITNVPVEHEIDLQNMAHGSCTDFLEGGYKHGANVIDKDMQIAKANCFMASVGRIDDSRMLVYKETDKKFELGREKGQKIYQGRSINVAEREIMMGYPKGYVESAGKCSSIYLSLAFIIPLIVLTHLASRPYFSTSST